MIEDTTEPAARTAQDRPRIAENRRQGNHLLGVAELPSAKPLAGRKVLVAEDNVILSMHVAVVLETAGAEVLGPYPFAEEAMGALETVQPDAALLDHELMGGDATPLADRLGRLGVPFAYFTGHARDEVAAAEAHVPFVPKPNDADALLGAVRAIIGD